MYLSYALDPAFVASYAKRRVPWGFPIGGGNYLGEVTYLRTYSRPVDVDFATFYGWTEGRKEEWYQACTRVINGMYSIQKDHALALNIPWSDAKAETSAEEAFDLMFNMKWLPPGRGIWMMGTRFVHEREGGGAALNNCGFVSTEDFPKAVAWLMEASMLGVGIGFNTNARGLWTIQEWRAKSTEHYVIPDTREGWVESTRRLVAAYLDPEQPAITFDYSLIRPEGEDIKGFGGKAAGPGPLISLHDRIHHIFDGRAGDHLNSVDVVDVMNLVGKCVVAGNVRRSAEIALGELEDEDFINLKNPDIFPERNDWDHGWGHLSNNTLIINAYDRPDYDALAERIAYNGEPGLIYMDLVRGYGRMSDPRNDKDYRAVGTNPCSEQSLESYELCCLVETFPTNVATLRDFLRVQKFAYLYAKTVTLKTTPWPETNAVMQRNRRIGTSVSGVVQFIEGEYTMADLRLWLEEGYSVVQDWDEMYSEWLCIRPSIKTTSVKPSGTVSLLAGVTPGVHWPVHRVYTRRMRMASHDPLVKACRDSGYHVEPDVKDPEGTSVVSFPVRGPKTRTEKEVSVWEKVALASLLQEVWADNQVSCTATFRKDEAGDIASVLRAYEGRLKSISFLPIYDGDAVFPQMPYETISDSEYERAAGNVLGLDMDPVYAEGLDAVGEKYCTTDKCEVSL